MDSEEAQNTKNDLKIIIIGNSGTGKTAFANKWVKNTFNEIYKATIVSDFSNKIFQYKDKFYRIQLWDLAVQDQNTMITKVFSKDAHGCVVLCDITNKQSMEDTLKWKESVDDTSRFLDGGLLPCVLVQNKIDLVDEEALKNDDEIKEFAQSHKFDSFFRTSAKMGIGIDECMDYLISNIIERSNKIKKDEDSDPFEKDKKNLVLDHKKPTGKAEGVKLGCC